MNFLNDYIPYGAQEAQYEREMEAAAYQEAIEEQQGEDATDIYNKLPEGVTAIFSPEVNRTFGDLFETDDDAVERVNNLLYELSLLEAKRREAA
ncbi:hypothetical protein [Xenorhabdus hominickii]|uniref:Uncharacterized protein n=1 Tax=Xenorhabdus hominickii TaxID=351679 RepID=A0A2G0QBI7_XENHO|nr:hypothetical protein [Xenorhabdus hominickii]AOM40534.1 hypothetical protein A9255_08010 [Xenorhabdus hominickii]PHM56519.1 hypothetical protein Xhom_02012 [Xenorhabdus hominickii]